VTGPLIAPAPLTIAKQIVTEVESTEGEETPLWTPTRIPACGEGMMFDKHARGALKRVIDAITPEAVPEQTRLPTTRTADGDYSDISIPNTGEVRSLKRRRSSMLLFKQQSQ